MTIEREMYAVKESSKGDHLSYVGEVPRRSGG